MATERRPGRRATVVVIAIAVVAAAIAIVVMRGGGDESTTAPGAATDEAGNAGGARPIARRAPEHAHLSDAEYLAEKAEFNRLKAQGARDAMAGIALNRDFPFWTRPLSDANRWQPPAPHHQLQQGPRSPGRAIELWPEKPVFLAGEPVIVHARVIEGAEGHARPLSIDDLQAVTESPPSLGRPELALQLRDDGKHGDAVAGDRTYTATVPITKAMAAEHPGWWGYRARALVGGEPFETSNQFQIWPIDVRLTGRYRDALEDGSLAIYAEVEARAAATIQVRGEVHGGGGEDIAFGWVNQDVRAGESEVRLLFYGKALHDRGLDGPYRIEHVVLGYPAGKLIGPDATDVAHRTAAYRAADFRGDGYNASDPLFADQLQTFEDELARAEKGELEPGLE